MYLNELNTPYESKMTLVMWPDGVSAGYVRAILQHVDGPVYKTYPRETEAGKASVDLYVAWGDNPALLLHRNVDHHRATVDGVREYTIQAHMDSYDNYLSYLDKLSTQGGWVSVVDLEFIRRADPERHKKYTEIRRAYVEQQDAKRRARAEARMVALNKKREEEAKQEAAQRKHLKAWCRNMVSLPLPLRYRKLRELVAVEGELMSWAEFLVSAVASGWVPYTYEDDRNGKRMYRLRHGERSYRLNQIQYEYAVYLHKHLPAKAKKNDRKEETA